MKRVIGNIVLAGASLAVSLLVLEIALRIYSGVPVFTTANFVARSLDIVRTNTGAMDFDETLGWRLKVNLGAPGTGFTTMDHGIRTNGTRRPMPSSGAVLAVGDSFTAGSGVRDEETWPALLEQRIGRPVLNGAAGAWGVDQMVLRAEQLAKVTKPTDLVVGILADDSLRNRYEVYGGGFKPWFRPTSDGGAELRGVPVPRFEDQPRGLGPMRGIFGRSWLVHWTIGRLGKMSWWVDDARRYRAVMSEQDGVNASCALMKRLKAWSGSTGARVIVVMFYGERDMKAAEPSWYGPPVVDCARRAGLEVLDLHPELHRLSKEDKSTFDKLWIDENGTPGHPTAAGHAITARLLQERFFAR